MNRVHLWYSQHRKRSIALVVLCGLFASCGIGVHVYNDHHNLSQDEFRAVVETHLHVGSSRQEIVQFLDDEQRIGLADGATLEYHGEVSPAGALARGFFSNSHPFEDRGIAPDTPVLVAKVANHGSEIWLAACTSDFWALFVLDETAERLQTWLFEPIPVCL